LYEFLTGNPPHIAESEAERFELARACLIPSPQSLMGSQIPPEEIVRITMKALKKVPAERFQSIGEMRTELDQYLKGSWKYATRHYQRGECLIRQGEVGDQAFLIKSGECEVFRTNENGQELFQATLKAGQTFGELSIFTKDPRSASVRATSEVSVQVIDQASFNDWLEIDPVIANFVQVLAARFKDLQDKKALVDAKYQQESLEGPFLLELARRIGQRGKVSLAEAANLAIEKGLDESYLSLIHNHRSFQVSDDDIALI
ncbi:MAG: cyclic nucleotide-binding domain-containing protein, partial [Planctomycetota bacterium]|nr:cyclic nucleotide-binding domain-containing protein [Planctomycetota bacterium]